MPVYSLAKFKPTTCEEEEAVAVAAPPIYYTSSFFEEINPGLQQQTAAAFAFNHLRRENFAGESSHCSWCEQDQHLNNFFIGGGNASRKYEGAKLTSTSSKSSKKGKRKNSFKKFHIFNPNLIWKFRESSTKLVYKGQGQSDDPLLGTSYFKALVPNICIFFEGIWPFRSSSLSSLNPALKRNKLFQISISIRKTPS